MSAQNFFRSALIVVLLASLYFSLTPGGQSPEIPVWDKALHFIGYFMLALLAELSIRPGCLMMRKIALVVIYSVVIELLQYFIPGREYSPFDILANVLGAASVLLLIPMLRYLRIYERLGLVESSIHAQ